MAKNRRAALTAEQRMRLLHMGPTVPIEIDVARAFGDETPTAPGAPSREVLASLVATEAVRGAETPALVPLDALPALAVAEGDVPWSDLGSLAAEVLRRVDGARSAMSIVTGLGAPPRDGVRVLASLVCRGLVRLVPPIAYE